jgi:hypothetical protein
MYLTIGFRCKAGFRKGDNDGDKGQSPCADVWNIRPPPWSPSRVHLPVEIKCSEIFPSIRDVSQR